VAIDAKRTSWYPFYELLPEINENFLP